jgi:parvulin-like peptidyl-prolyl isomerase
VKKLLALAVATVVLAGCGSLTSYAAKVNGQRITQNELERELNAILGNKAYLDQVDEGFSQETGQRARGVGEDTFNTVFVARVLQRRVRLELIRQEVRRRNLEVGPRDLEDARRQLVQSVEDEKVFDAFPESYRDELVRSFAEAFVLERALTNVRVDDAAIRSFYDANKATFESTCLRQIQVEDRSKAAQIKARVAAGEDFAAIARAESKTTQGPGSAAQGGDAGCADKGQLPPQIETVLNALRPGQVSDPIQTPLGFHVVQVTERRVKSLEEATPDIRQRLQPGSSEALRNFVDEALSKARVTVNPRYGKFVRSEQEVGIKAPNELTDTAETPGPAPPP